MWTPCTLLCERIKSNGEKREKTNSNNIENNIIIISAHWQTERKLLL